MTTIAILPNLFFFLPQWSLDCDKKCPFFAFFCVVFVVSFFFQRSPKGKVPHGANDPDHPSLNNQSTGAEPLSPGNFNKFAKDSLLKKSKLEFFFFLALLSKRLFFSFFVLSCVLPVKLYLILTSPGKTGQFLLFWKDVVLNDCE